MAIRRWICPLTTTHEKLGIVEGKKMTSCDADVAVAVAAAVVDVEETRHCSCWRVADVRQIQTMSMVVDALVAVAADVAVTVAAAVASYHCVAS